MYLSYLSTLAITPVTISPSPSVHFTSVVVLVSGTSMSSSLLLSLNVLKSYTVYYEPQKKLIYNPSKPIHKLQNGNCIDLSINIFSTMHIEFLY